MYYSDDTKIMLTFVLWNQMDILIITNQKLTLKITNQITKHYNPCTSVIIKNIYLLTMKLGIVRA